MPDAPGVLRAPQPCGHYVTETGYCGAPAHHRYLPGWRCPDHTPAALRAASE